MRLDIEKVLARPNNMQSLKGIFPKPQAPPKHNFIKENVRNIKLMQQRKQSAFQSNTIKIEENKLRNSNLRKFRSPSNARIPNRSSANAAKSIVSSKSVENVSNVNYARKVRPLSVQSRDAWSQTETVDGELFLKDVIIRLPSAVVFNSGQKNSDSDLKIGDKVNENSQENDPTDFLQQEIRFQTDKSNGADDIDKVSMSTWRNAHDLRNEGEMLANDPVIEADIARPIQHFSARCQQSLAICANKDTSKSTVPPSYRVGELPNYLKEMKIKEAEKNRLESLIDVNCPPGHIVLSEEDRIDALNIANKKYKDLINDLNRLPMTSQTLRVRNCQIEIEKELRQLDETIQICSRSKVYVRID